MQLLLHIPPLWIRPQPAVRRPGSALRASLKLPRFQFRPILEDSNLTTSEKKERRLVSKSSLGEFEKLVMLAVLHLAQEAYGATIIQELEARTRRTVSAGAVYVALRRLEKKGLVTSRLGTPSPQRGGRAKRFFTVNRLGVESLRRAQEDWVAMVSGLPEILGHGN